MMSEVLESRSEDNLEDKKEKKVSCRTGYAGNCLLDVSSNKTVQK